MSAFPESRVKESRDDDVGFGLGFGNEDKARPTIEYTPTRLDKANDPIHDPKTRQDKNQDKTRHKSKSKPGRNWGRVVLSLQLA
jgi:hypothetical protein